MDGGASVRLRQGGPVLRARFEVAVARRVALGGGVAVRPQRNKGQTVARLVPSRRAIAVAEVEVRRDIVRPVGAGVHAIVEIGHEQR